MEPIRYERKEHWQSQLKGIAAALLQPGTGGAGDGPLWVYCIFPMGIKTNLGTPASIKALKESVMLRHRLACSVRAELNRMGQMTPTVSHKGAMAAEVELLKAVLDLLMGKVKVG